MDKKIKIGLLLLGIYMLVFGVGFKVGAMYLRMQNRIRIESIEIPASKQQSDRYFIITRNNYGSYSQTDFVDADEGNVMIKIFKNEALRPLLKSRDMEIYKDTGERIY